MYKRMNEITKSLEKDLMAAHAIDADKKVINTSTFKKILKQKIDALSELESFVSDEMGVVRDREGANILFDRISELQNMLDTNSLTPEEDIANVKMRRAEKKFQSRVERSSLFRRAIAKLFGPNTQTFKDKSR